MNEKPKIGRWNKFWDTINNLFETDGDMSTSEIMGKICETYNISLRINERILAGKMRTKPEYTKKGMKNCYKYDEKGGIIGSYKSNIWGLT